MAIVTGSDTILLCCDTATLLLLSFTLIVSGIIVFALEIPSSHPSPPCSVFSRPHTPSAIALALYLIIKPTVTGPKIVLSTMAHTAVMKAYFDR